MSWVLSLELILVEDVLELEDIFNRGFTLSFTGVKIISREIMQHFLVFNSLFPFNCMNFLVLVCNEVLQ